MKKIIIIFLMLFTFTSSTLFANPSSITNVESLPEGHKLKNPYKTWSVLKAIGLSDEASAGVLANINNESGFDPTMIEGIYDEYLNPNGKRKKEAIKDINNYVITQLFPMYVREGWGISYSKNKLGQEVKAVPRGKANKGIDSGAYLGVDGKYTVGMGLFQLTGPRASLFQSWAEKRSLKWYTMEVQLFYLIYKGEGQDGRTNWLYNVYKKDKSKSPEDLAVLFSEKYEGQFQDKENRRKPARYWYDMFKGLKGDGAYAQKILAGANLQAEYNLGDGFEDKSILKELFSPTIIMNRIGNMSKKQQDIALDIQNEIINNQPKEKRYSLYERFGSDVHFFRYMGESTQPIKLGDHIFSVIEQDRLDKLNFGTFFYTSGVYLSNNVYPNRPKVLTGDNLLNGYSDPRVITQQNNFGSGYVYNSSEFNLTIAKGITGLVTLLISNEPLKVAKDLIGTILSNKIFLKFFFPIFQILLSFAFVGLLFSIFNYGLKAIKGKKAFSELMKRVVVGIISLGIAYSFMNNPSAFNEAFYKGATVIDKTFNVLLNEQNKKDVIVSSSDGEKTQEALLWRKTIFDNWVQAIFLDKYENLYTQFSDKPNKMKQSYTKKDELSRLKTGEYRFSSAEYTGDVKVPLGNNHFEQNWGAYLYSTQSPYHIDYSVVDGKNKTPSNTFPNATTTADKKVNADTFRVLDALMDISPQHYKDDLKVENYNGSKVIREDYIKFSSIMIRDSFMLAITFLPLIFVKIRHLIMLLANGIQMIFFSLREAIKDGDGFNKAYKSIYHHAFEYFIATFKLYILTILFSVLIGKGIIEFILYILFALNIYIISIPTIRRKIRKTYNNIKYKIRGLRNKI